MHPKLILDISLRALERSYGEARGVFSVGPEKKDGIYKKIIGF
jgi:hypothetical protein